MTGRISQADRTKLFGPPCQAGATQIIRTPWGLDVRVHKLIAAKFVNACYAAQRASAWTPRRIDAYNCRKVRGSDTQWSLHSWALAWDFFDSAIPSTVWGPTHAPPAAFLAEFRARGFACGADYTSRKDYPHIEWADAPPGDRRDEDNMTDAEKRNLFEVLARLDNKTQELINRVSNVERDVAAIKARP